LTAAPSARPAILVTGADLAPEALALLRDYEIVYAGKTPSEADIAALCRRHNPAGVIVRYGKFGAAAIEAAPALRVISKHGSGTDTIDKAAARARGVEVVAAAGANAAAVAEHALALLLACAKSIVTLNARMHGGHWDKAAHRSLELEGRTVGVIGLGAIGQRFAKMAASMGTKVLGFDPFAGELAGHIQQSDLATIWRESDAISLHCPLTDETRGMVNRDGLIEEDALLEAVRSGQIGSAGLDSFAAEPMAKGHPFQEEDRIVLSPHIGGVTANAYVKMGLAAAQNVLAVLEN
jgi:D-3-phosphoglycerate dehydrogenase